MATRFRAPSKQRLPHPSSGVALAVGAPSCVSLVDRVYIALSLSLSHSLSVCVRVYAFVCLNRICLSMGSLPCSLYCCAASQLLFGGTVLCLFRFEIFWILDTLRTNAECWSVMCSCGCGCDMCDLYKYKADQLTSCMRRNDGNNSTLVKEGHTKHKTHEVFNNQLVTQSYRVEDSNTTYHKRHSSPAPDT